MKARICRDCAFFSVNTPTPDANECRFDPPIIHPSLVETKEGLMEKVEHGFVANWPPALPERWCGKWKDKDTDKLSAKYSRLEKAVLNILVSSRVCLSGVALPAGEVESYCVRIGMDFRAALQEAREILQEEGHSGC